MIPKSGNLFSEKIMLEQQAKARGDDSKKSHPALAFRAPARGSRGAAEPARDPPIVGTCSAQDRAKNNKSRVRSDSIRTDYAPADAGHPAPRCASGAPFARDRTRVKARSGKVRSGFRKRSRFKQRAKAGRRFEEKSSRFGPRRRRARARSAHPPCGKRAGINRAIKLCPRPAGRRSRPAPAWRAGPTR